MPMIGYLVSAHTLRGGAARGRFVPPEALPFMTRMARDSALNMIHYSSRHRRDLCQQVSTLLDGLYQQGLVRALQLNIRWPVIREVRAIAHRFPDLQLVLIVNRGALRQDLRKLRRRIRHYAGAVHHVLLDPSGGRGVEFEMDRIVEVYQAIEQSFPHLTIGVAGGLHGANVRPRLAQLIRRTGTNAFSIDAEGGLRTESTDRGGRDALDPCRVESYLQGAASELGRECNRLDDGGGA